jgi:hypothetical protein
MSYSFDEVKKIIEDMEMSNVVEEVSLLEQKEGLLNIQHSIIEKTSPYLNFLGMLFTGLSIGILTIIMNYLFFVWLLHLEL